MVWTWRLQQQSKTAAKLCPCRIWSMYPFFSKESHKHDHSLADFLTQDANSHFACSLCCAKMNEHCLLPQLNSSDMWLQQVLLMPHQCWLSVKALHVWTSQNVYWMAFAETPCYDVYIAYTYARQYCWKWQMFCHAEQLQPSVLNYVSYCIVQQ